MSTDEENVVVDVPETDVVDDPKIASRIEEPKKKMPKKGVMTEKRKQNLEKASAAKLKNVKQYPVGAKRDAAEAANKEIIEARVLVESEKRARKLAEEIIKQKEHDQEMAEFLKWKNESSKAKKSPEKKSKGTGKAAPKKKTVTKTKRNMERSDGDSEEEARAGNLKRKNPIRKKPTRKPQKLEDDEEHDDFPIMHSRFDMSHFLD